ncbi:DUF6984 family protein [Algoriphagus vanfongensis]|uniref:DUF6984 family protein n=1 Tax=Algoriphagus vanfongensis TaxID=426371 RepID=UPI0012F8EF84|nr:hypothetical protein [Algoriphagus vanfongensis]
MRKISNSEKRFLMVLLKLSGLKVEIPEMVIQLKDGKMGSTSFDLTQNQSRSERIVAGNFIDDDGILVDFELTMDLHGNLFELDFWKVDFSQLVSFPEENEIEITYSGDL